MVTTNIKSLLPGLLLLVSVQLFSQNKISAKLLATEQARFEAMMQRDTAALQQMLADDLVYIHSNALKEDKKEHLHTIATGKIVYGSMNRESVSTRVYGKTAITNGIIQVKGVVSGNPFDVRMLYTAIYSKKKKNWQLANWQSTRLP